MEKKENKPVVDFSEFPTTSAEEFIMMDDELFELYEMYCDFIQLATSLPAGASTNSDFFCRQVLEDGELCDGNIEVAHTELPKQVHWKCESCGYGGAIINYEDSAWDNTNLSDNEKQAFLTSYSAFSGDMDYYDDMMYDVSEDEADNPFVDFEFYLNPYDPDGTETGGPTSQMIEKMLNYDWEEPGSPVYLRDTLPYSELQHCDFFYNARQFLLTLQKAGEFELTRNQFLKRKSVNLLLEQTRWPEGHLDNIRKYKEYIDETDELTIHGIRLLVDIAGLTQQTDDNRYLFNESKQDILKEDNAGKLYRTLVSAYFKEMDMAYLGTRLDIPQLQYSIPFIIYQLTVHAQDWTPIDDLLPEILLFSVKVELDLKNMDGINISEDLLSEDLFASLERFCLVETRRVSEPDPDDPINYPDQLRITPLLEKFTEFNLDN